MHETTSLPGVTEVLVQAQRLGFLGDRPIPDVVEHSLAFVRAVRARCQQEEGHRQWDERNELLQVSQLGDVPMLTWPRVIDLGSGGGVPGLIVAGYCPTVRVTLVDRRTKRTDFLQRAVQRLGWSDRVDVVAGDVDELRRRTAWAGTALVVTARGFGPPRQTLRWGVELVRPGGWVVISEPPPGAPDRWSDDDVQAAGARRLTPEPPGTAGVVVFERVGAPRASPA